MLEKLTSFRRDVVWRYCIMAWNFSSPYLAREVDIENLLLTPFCSDHWYSTFHRLPIASISLNWIMRRMNQVIDITGLLFSFGHVFAGFTDNEKADLTMYRRLSQCRNPQLHPVFQFRSRVTDKALMRRSYVDHSRKIVGLRLSAVDSQYQTVLYILREHKQLSRLPDQCKG